jgi:hypothetical protein
VRVGSRHVFLALALLLGFVCPARSKTWIVDSAGQGDFVSIQAAVEAASASDIILIRPGRYREPVRINSERSGIVLKGDAPPEQVIIESDSTVIGIWGTNPAVRVESVTITGGSVFGGVWVQGARAEIVNCIITGNDGPGGCNAVGGAGRFIFNSDVLVEGCLIEENHGWEAPGGLIIWSSRADIRGSVFRNNTSCYGGGLEIYHCETSGVSTIENNVFEGNMASEWGGGIFNVDSSPVIRSNTFVRNGADSKAAIWVLGGQPEIDRNLLVDSRWAVYCQTHSKYPPSRPNILDNMCWAIEESTLTNCSASSTLPIEDPLFCDGSTGNYTLCSESPAIHEGSVVYGALDAGCSACEPTAVKQVGWGSLKALFR